jgi:hypothetical protein
LASFAGDLPTLAEHVGVGIFKLLEEGTHLLFYEGDIMFHIIV